MQTKPARLILENGMCFEGVAFGYVHDVVGDVVFSTATTGYQEGITDPSLCGQMLVCTYPLIGNYGINFEDMEAEKPVLTALIVREKCDYPNNFRTEMELDGFLRQNKILGLEGVDTRAITRLLRDSGSMRGVITTEDISEQEVQERINALDNSDVVKRVSCEKPYKIDGNGKKVAVIDLGIKSSILNQLKERDCDIFVYPYNTSADEILKSGAEVVLVSSGPGNPEDISETVEIIKELIGKVKLCGISLGHLVIGLALGCSIKKLKFGHHGGNQPVRDTKTNKVTITSQGHDYVLESIAENIEVSFENVNDGTCEGIKGDGIMSVQFHPEGAPGPREMVGIFDEFLA